MVFNYCIYHYGVSEVAEVVGKVANDLQQHTLEPGSMTYVYSCMGRETNKHVKNLVRKEGNHV